MAEYKKTFEELEEVAVVGGIRQFIRETGDVEGTYVCLLPYLVGTGLVIDTLEKLGYQVSPRGLELTIEGPFPEGAFYSKEGTEDYWSMRKRLG